MRRLTIFCIVVLASGWFLGYLMAQEMRGKQSPTPFAMILSLGAVLAPAAMAILLSSGPERWSLIKQLRIVFPAHVWLVTLSFPLVLALIGHIAGAITARGEVAMIPAQKFFIAGLQMLPVAIVWGMLEEVGWRAFFTAQLGQQLKPIVASLLVGLVWGIWHAPQMFFSDQPFEGAFKDMPIAGATFWTAACVAYGGVLGWLQLKSGSFVPPMIAHALINTFGKISEGSMAGHMNPFWAGTGGIPAIIFSSLLLAGLFHFF